MRQKEESELVDYFNNQFKDFLKVTENLINESNKAIQYLEKFKDSDRYSKLQISQQNTINKSIECYDHMQHMKWSWVIPKSVNSKSEINEIFNNIYNKLTFNSENIGFKNYFTSLCWATSRLPMLQELLSDDEGRNLVSNTMIKPIQTPTHLFSSFQTWEKEWLNRTGQKSETLTNTKDILKDLQLTAESLYNDKHKLTNKLKSKLTLAPKKQSYLEDPFYLKTSNKISKILQKSFEFYLPNQDSTDEDSNDETPPVPTTNIEVPSDEVLNIPQVPKRAIPINSEIENRILAKSVDVNDKKGSVWIEILLGINNLHQNLQTYSNLMVNDSTAYNGFNDQLMAENKKILDQTALEFTESDKVYFHIAQGYINAINKLLISIKDNEFEANLAENSDVSTVQKAYEEALFNYQQIIADEKSSGYSHRVLVENKQIMTIFDSLLDEVVNKMIALEDMKVQWKGKSALIDQRIDHLISMKKCFDNSNVLSESNDLHKRVQVFMDSELSAESLAHINKAQAHWQNLKISDEKSFAKMIHTNGNRLVNQSIAFKFNQALNELDTVINIYESNIELYTKMNYSLLNGDISVLDKLNAIQKQAENYRTLAGEKAYCQIALERIQNLFNQHNPENNDFAARLKIKEATLSARTQQLSTLGSKMLNKIASLYDNQRIKTLSQNNPAGLIDENTNILNHPLRSQLQNDLLLHGTLDSTVLGTCMQKIEKFERTCQRINLRSDAVKIFVQKLSKNASLEKIAFIDSLKPTLRTYACSGEVDPVLEKIEEGKKEFSDISFKSHLNKIALEIMEEEDNRPIEFAEMVLPEPVKVPENLDIPQFNPPEPDLPVFRSAPDQAKTVLHKLLNADSKKKRYAGYFLDLFAQVDKFLSDASHLPEDKKTFVNSIHSGLVNDVSIFVLQHQNNLPKEEDLKRFNKKFTYRLHSKDHKLEVHTTPPLARFFANLIINLLLCIPVFVSLATTGRYSCLFNSTTREKNRDNIDSSRNEMWENRATFCTVKN
ncbi:MAG: hypothetical protein H0U57_08120 [Tatlockia sp.]|nr:hypothetical protein [Tatlockia sp.]